MATLLPLKEIYASPLVCMQHKSCHSGQQGAVYRVQWWSKTCIFIDRVCAHLYRRQGPVWLVSTPCCQTSHLLHLQLSVLQAVEKYTN